MERLIKPGLGVLYMKVGTHARESLEDILLRKTREIEEAGYALWGYGGGTCHPLTTVQPFARTYVKRGGKILLIMERIDSRHHAEQLRAKDMSHDGISWSTIPATINALGSRYALVIKDLRPEEMRLPLSATHVAYGRSAGVLGSTYIRGRVDKACLELVDQDVRPEEEETKISLIAEIIPPYAVFLRS